MYMMTTPARDLTIFGEAEVDPAVSRRMRELEDEAFLVGTGR